MLHFSTLIETSLVKVQNTLCLRLCKTPIEPELFVGFHNLKKKLEYISLPIKERFAEWNSLINGL
jgi:hypothetical protein